MFCMVGERQGVAAQGERIGGGFILITGLDGIRYAVRPQSVGIIHDAGNRASGGRGSVQRCHGLRLSFSHGKRVGLVRCPCSRNRQEV